MKKTSSPKHTNITRANQTASRPIRLSAMRLLAAGALCAAAPASAIEITNVGQFQPALDNATINGNDFTIQLIITDGDLNLGGDDFFVGRAGRGLARISTLDGVTRTVTNGSITVLSADDANYSLLTLDPSVSWNTAVIVEEFSRLDIDGPAALGASATVTAEAGSEIRLFTFDGVVNTWTASDFAKITGADDQTTIAIVGNGETILNALPTFDALIDFNIYADFDDFAANPAADPLATLSANLSGNHAVSMTVGTLDLDDFDFTIDSLEGALDARIDLGSGTLTTGDTSDTTFAGIISGTGDLTKTGTGSFTLSGINTYTGTTTVTEGRLILDADQTGPSAVVIEDGGTVQINIDQTGTPTYDVQTGGTLELFADLDDDVAITADGLVELNSIDQTFGSIAGGGTINLEDADLVVGDATDTTFSGTINNSGSLTKVGTSNLTLSGVNTYTGQTTISEGTITLDGDLNDASTVSIATGATLDLNDNDETLGTIIGAGDITLGSGTLTVGNATDFAFDGVLSETGGLTKQGDGTLTLSAAQTFTGSTVVADGTLIVNGTLATSDITVNDGGTLALEAILTDAGSNVTVDDGGTLFGTGTIGNDLTNNGTISFVGPGLGDTLTVSGDYTQGSTGTLSTTLDGAGGLVVAGTFNAAGTLDINIPADPANFDINATYTPITAGSIVGNFDTVTSDFAFLDLTSTLNGGNVEITLARNAVALDSIARSANQATIAQVLDGLVGPTGELNDALNRVLASSEDGARATYDQLAGPAASTASTTIAASAVNQTHRILDQVVGVLPATSRPLGSFGRGNGPAEFDEFQHLMLFSTSVLEEGDIRYRPQNQDVDNDIRYRPGNQNADEGDLQYDPQQQELSQEKPTVAGLDPYPWATFYGGIGDQGDGAEGLDYNRFGLLVGLELQGAESEARYGISLGFEQADFEFNLDNGDVDLMS
ncbi:MAG: autotransporter-associated beta strand repeat-containing protein, partial [Phycisphaeraceae bacterium]